MYMLQAYLQSVYVTLEAVLRDHDGAAAEVHYMLDVDTTTYQKKSVHGM